MATPETEGGAGVGAARGHGESRRTFDRSLVMLKRRLVQEATSAVNMLEASLEALWKLDKEAAQGVRRRDDMIDREEVAIEEECLKALTLQQPVARDLRILTFVLKVNSDIERVADHAKSIAKVTLALESVRPPRWPTSLVELGQRVPMMCHALLRSVLDEDESGARLVRDEDKTIDALDRRLFDEVVDAIRKDQVTPADGLLIYRTGRELERVGDLMTSIAEDVIFLATGRIVRHAKKLGQDGVGA